MACQMEMANILRGAIYMKDNLLKVKEKAMVLKLKTALNMQAILYKTRKMAIKKFWSILIKVNMRDLF